VISCDGGRITIQDGCISIERLTDSIRAKTATSASLFGTIGSRQEIIKEPLVESAPELLARMYENIALAIAARQKLLVTAAESANAVELANAIMLSAHSGRRVDLPLDRDVYEAFISAKVRGRSAPTFVALS
jgi:hypothetical protein